MKLIFENWHKYLTEQVYRRGMKDPGPEGPIAQLQTKLKELGYDLGAAAVDGKYGSKTKAAVYKFQQKAFPKNRKEWDGVAGENTLTKLGLAKTVAPAPVAVTKAAVKQKSAAAMAPKKKVAARPVGDRPRALIIGDSHAAGDFGRAMAMALKTQGYEVARRGVGGSSARVWLKGEACWGGKCGGVTKLQKQAPWDLLLISLGTNDIANSNVGCKRAGKHNDIDCLKLGASKKVAQIGQVAARIKAKKTVWIAPPNLEQTKGHYSKVASDVMYTVGKPSGVDVMIDSRPSTAGRHGKKDKVHLFGAAAKAWAAAVVSAL